MRTLLAVFAVSLWTTAPALAQGDNAEGFYLGAGLGDFSTDIDELDDVDDVDLEFDSDENARKMFAGWRFNRFFAVQLDVVDFERSVDARNALDVVATQSEGIAPGMVGTLPLGPVELFARRGFSGTTSKSSATTRHWSTTATATRSSAPASASRSRTA